MPERQQVSIGGRSLSVTNLARVMYPDDGVTKAQVLEYLLSVAERLHGSIADRILTRKRWPHGVAEQSFFEKNLPAGAPDWIHRQTFDDVTYPVIRAGDDPRPALAWFAQLGVLEFHVPQWRLDPEGEPLGADRMVIDLDPGPPAGLAECAEAALLIRDVLGPLGLSPRPVLSGSKGMQLYVDLSATTAIPLGTPNSEVSEFAKNLALQLSAAHPQLIEWRMKKSLRTGKVFLDWSQNVAAKTTIAPWSPRGTPHAHIAKPVSWTEVEAGRLRQAPLTT